MSKPSIPKYYEWNGHIFKYHYSEWWCYLGKSRWETYIGRINGLLSRMAVAYEMNPVAEEYVMGNIFTNESESRKDPLNELEKLLPKEESKEE